MAPTRRGIKDSHIVLAETSSNWSDSTIETPDLTELSKRNGGAFPTEAVAMQVDGRFPLLAHGGEMPIFGPSLESDQNVTLRMKSGQQLMTGVPLANVIVYLESLQTE